MRLGASPKGVRISDFITRSHIAGRNARARLHLHNPARSLMILTGCGSKTFYLLTLIPGAHVEIVFFQRAASSYWFLHGATWSIFQIREQPVLFELSGAISMKWTALKILIKYELEK